MALSVGMNSLSYRILSSLSKVQSDNDRTMERLATGQRINRASDDPSGMVAVNALNGQLARINAAVEGNERSQSLLNVADDTLTEIGTLTAEIERLASLGTGSGISASEKAAYQAQIDNTIDQIDRLLSQAEFNGSKIFTGDNVIQAYTNSAPAIKDIEVYSRNPNVSGNLTLNVNVTAVATRGTSGNTFSAVTMSTSSTLQITGKHGSTTVTLLSSYSSANILSAIRGVKGMTGVSANVVGGRVQFMTTDTGSDAFVTVSVLNGSNKVVTSGNVAKTAGTDATVRVNGETANAQGSEVYYTGNGVSLSFTFAGTTTGTRTITITGGGATFQLGTDTYSRTTVGMGGLNTAELGRSGLGYLRDMKTGGSQSLSASGTNAVAIARQASKQVSMQAARIGSFNKYQVGTSLSSLQAQQTEMTSAVDAIQKTDYAFETAEMERQSILLNAGVALLSAANARQQSVLALLS